MPANPGFHAVWSLNYKKRLIFPKFFLRAFLVIRSKATVDCLYRQNRPLLTQLNEFMRLHTLYLCVLCSAPFVLFSCVNSSDSSKPSTYLFKNIKIKKELIPLGNLNRRREIKMKPRYITIHSTANTAPTADAEAHKRLLHRAGLGRLSWHYTVDDSTIYQTLPNTEQGQHADYNGPGNRYSIGIEMCENKGNSRTKTVEKTAKLAAQLMKTYDIPINRVVPHYHWRRVHPNGKDFGHKACPQFLMDNGKPGKRWNDFRKLVMQYHKQ